MHILVECWRLPRILSLLLFVHHKIACWFVSKDSNETSFIVKFPPKWQSFPLSHLPVMIQLKLKSWVTIRSIDKNTFDKTSAKATRNNRYRFKKKKEENFAIFIRMFSVLLLSVIFILYSSSKLPPFSMKKKKKNLNWIFFFKFVIETRIFWKNRV